VEPCARRENGNDSRSGNKQDGTRCESRVVANCIEQEAADDRTHRDRKLDDGHHQATAGFRIAR
jgi:hypothetical protein